MGKTVEKISFRKGGDKGVVIGYKTWDENGPKDTTKKVAKHPPHKDFIEKMQAIKPHLCLIAEWNGTLPGKFKKFGDYKISEAEDKELRIVGITKCGEEEKTGVIITAYRTLSTGQGFVFNTPLKLFLSEGDTAYKFMPDLETAISEVEKEAEEYLKGKYGIVQGTLFNTGGNEEE